MENVIIRSRENIFTLDIEDIDKYTLFDIFSSKLHDTIYVTENKGIERLVGIITQGDFSRNIRNSKESFVNVNFAKVCIDDEEKAIEILEAREKINSVPVVDENNTLVKEYCRLNKSDVSTSVLSDEMVKVICYEVAFTYKKCYDKVIFLTDNKTDILQVANDKKITVLNNIDLHQIEAYSNESAFVCDLRCMNEGIRSSIYNKFSIYNVIWGDNLSEKEICEIVDDRLALYNNIGVLDEAYAFYRSMYPDRNICKIYSDELKWNSQQECYEYIGKTKDIEAIYMFSCCLKNPYVIIKDKLIPIISLKFVEKKINNIEGFRTEDIMSGIDVIYNIIPKLKDNNVKCIVIENANNELYKLKDYLKKDITIRSNALSNIYEITNFINESDKLDREIAQEIAKELVPTLMPIYRNGFMQVKNLSGKYVNFINGERYTYNNPDKFDNIIYIFGPCVAYGGYIEDRCAIGSLLRDKIDSRYYIKNCGYRWRTMNYVMRTNEYEEGDIAVIFANDGEAYKKT